MSEDKTRDSDEPDVEAHSFEAPKSFEAAAADKTDKSYEASDNEEPDVEAHSFEAPKSFEGPKSFE
jgi:hypothetical protein